MLIFSFSLFFLTNNVSAISLNGYSVDDEVIQACNNLDYNYHFIFQEKGYYNYYVFSCSYYPATFYNNGSSWGKGFYYHTIYDDNGNFKVINASGDTNKSNSFKAYKNGSISSSVTRHTGLASGTVTYYSNHKIYNYVYGTSDISTLYYDCNGDSCISNTAILSPDYKFIDSFYIGDFDTYTLQFNIDKLLIEEQKKINFRLEALMVNQQIPDAPIFKLYKKVDNELILVEDDSITYDWREYEDSDYYYIDGYINFSEDVSYLNDYVLEIELANVPNTVVKVYDDSSLCSWTGSYSFLKNYIKYIFPKGYDYAFISKSENATSNIYLSNDILNYSDYNYSNMNHLEVRDYNYSSKKYTLILPTQFISNLDMHKYDINIDHNLNNVVVIKQYFVENATNIPYFYVPRGYTVKFASFNENNGIIITDIYDDSYLYETPDNNIDSDNFFGTDDDELSENGLDKEFIGTFTGAINFFITPIKEIFKLITIFYNNLNVPLKMFFISLFGLVISIFIVRFLL